MKSVLLRWLPTRQCHLFIVVCTLGLLGALLLAGVVPATFLVGALPFMFLGDTNVQGTDTQTGGASSATKAPWRRVREKSPVTFQNVNAGSTAYAEFPRYALTLLNLSMTLSGTTFNKTHLQTIRLRLGSHVLWQFSSNNAGGPNLNIIQSYLLGNTLSFLGLLN